MVCWYGKDPRVVPLYVICWLYMLTVLVRSEYVTNFNVLSGPDGLVDDSRHNDLLNTALVVKPHDELPGFQTVFPSLNFNCSGVVHKIFLVAREGSGSQAPSISLWEKGPIFESPLLKPPRFPLDDPQKILHSSETDIALYEHMIDREFSSGDMIGFLQPNASSSSIILRYQDRSGDNILLDEDISIDDIPFWPTRINPGSMLPLIAIETSNPECNTGFLTRRTLEDIVINYLAIDDTSVMEISHEATDRQLLFPNMTFTCSSTVSRLIIGANILKGGLSTVPEIQVWREEDGNSNMFTKIDSVPLSIDVMQDISPTLKLYQLEASLSFMRGDVLGIYYPQESHIVLHTLIGHGSVIHSRNVGPMLTSPDSFQLQDIGDVSTTKHWPLVALNDGNTGCLDAFMSESILTLLVQKQQLTHVPTEQQIHHIVPDLKFTTSGLLTRWLFVSREDSQFKLEFPNFFVWRQNNQGYTMVDGTTTNVLTPMRSHHLNVYEYILDPPAQVEVDDFIGWEQVADHSIKYLPLVLNNTGYSIERVTDLIFTDIRSTVLLPYRVNPLIGVQLLSNESIGTSSSPIPSPTTTMPTLATDPDDTEDNGIQQLLSVILGSGVMGIVIILGLVIAFFFIMWAIRRHHKKRNRKISAETGDIDLNNPLYIMTQSQEVGQPVKQSNGTQRDELRLQPIPAPTHPAPPTPLIRKDGSVQYDEPLPAPLTPVIRKDGSVQYDKPITTMKKLPPPPVAPKPPRSPSPCQHYHTLERQDHVQLSPHGSTITSPHFPASPHINLSPLSPSSPHYHSLEPTSPLLSLQTFSRGSPHYLTSNPGSPLPSTPAGIMSLDRRSHKSSVSTSTFGSLDRHHISHAREHSNTSEQHLIQQQPSYDDPSYDVIQPSQLESRAASTIRLLSSTSSYTGAHSRTSSQATMWDDEPTDHLYHQLTSQEGYSRLYQSGLCVPTQEQRQLAATTARRQKINIYAALSEFSPVPSEKEVMFFKESDSYWRPARDSNGLYAQLAQRKYREIMRNQIKIQHVLGSGNFGEVNKGEWQCKEGVVEVAVKTLKKGSSEDDIVRFLQEAAIMGQFRHPNIVQLLGVVTLRQPVMIVLELLSQGDLRNHLFSLRPLTPGDAVPEGTHSRLLKYCQEIVSGMEYLERKMFVHRDLAARNILVADDDTCKIGDFGMARDLEDESYYISRGGKIPIRWSPPEALNFKKYTTASDVWSFGIVMYEIWSLGHKPYEGYTNPQTQKLVERGERLAPPPGCPRSIYSLMINSWHPDHSSRPTFLSLLKTLSGGITSEVMTWGDHGEGDSEVTGLARTLGAPLDSGRNLYLELQHAYYT